MQQYVKPFIAIAIDYLGLSSPRRASRALSADSGRSGSTTSNNVVSGMAQLHAAPYEDMTGLRGEAEPRGPKQRAEKGERSFLLVTFCVSATILGRSSGSGARGGEGPHRFAGTPPLLDPFLWPEP